MKDNRNSNSASNQIVTFVIGLDEAPFKNPQLIDNLTSLNIEFEFFKATDGRFLTENETALYSQKKSRKLLGYDLSPMEVARAISHVRVYEKIVKDEIPIALVLEENARINQALVHVLENVQYLSEDWGVVNLASPTFTYPLGHEIAPGFQISEYRKPPESTVAYFVTLEAAAQILEVAYPIRCPSDFLLGRAGMKYFKTFGIYPRLIGQISRIDGRSEIGITRHNPNLIWRMKRYLRMMLPQSLRKVPNLPDGTESRSLAYSLRNRDKYS